MAIFYAKLVDSNGEFCKLISIKDISNKEDYHKNYFGRILCPEDNCSAELVYVDKSSNGLGDYFRTYKNSKHSLNCKFNFETRAALQGQKYGEILVRGLSKAQKARILYGAKRARKEDGQESKVIDKKRISRIVNRDENKKEGSRISLVTDPNIEILEKGNRSPGVRKRDCNDIGVRDLNKTRCVSGKIKQILIGKDIIKVFFDTYNGQSVFAEFYNAFKNNSPGDYDNLLKLSGREKSCILKNFDSIGLVVQRRDGYGVEIMDSDCVSFNSNKIGSFVCDALQTKL